MFTPPFPQDQDAMEPGWVDLRWGGHRHSFVHHLNTFRLQSQYTDATIACEGRSFHVHQLVLSACSDFFASIFANIKCHNPVVILQDVGHVELEILLDYIYRGEVQMRKSDLPLLMKVAESLQIKGLGVARSDNGCQQSEYRNGAVASDDPSEFQQCSSEESLTPRQPENIEDKKGHENVKRKGQDFWNSPSKVTKIRDETIKTPQMPEVHSKSPRLAVDDVSRDSHLEIDCKSVQSNSQLTPPALKRSPSPSRVQRLWSPPREFSNDQKHNYGNHNESLESNYEKNTKLGVTSHVTKRELNELNNDSSFASLVGSGEAVKVEPGEAPLDYSDERARDPGQDHEDEPRVQDLSIKCTTSRLPSPDIPIGTAAPVLPLTIPNSQLRRELLRPVQERPRVLQVVTVPAPPPAPLAPRDHLDRALREPPPLVKIDETCPLLIKNTEDRIPKSPRNEVLDSVRSSHLLVKAPPTYQSRSPTQFSFHVHSQHLGSVLVNGKLPEYNLIPNNDGPLNLSGSKHQKQSEEKEDNQDPFLGKIVTNRKKRLRGPKSWEFLVRLLQDPSTNPYLIQWENEQAGVFRLKEPAIIAQRWGRRTGKHSSDCLSYENFARGLRYHYATGALQPVSERSFVYKFGPKALKVLQESSVSYA